MAVINKTWPFFHAGFSYDFPSTVLEKEKGKRHPELAGGRSGEREGDVWLEFKSRNLVSFSEDLENIKGAGVSFIHSDSEIYKKSVSFLVQIP